MYIAIITRDKQEKNEKASNILEVFEGSIGQGYIIASKYEQKKNMIIEPKKITSHEAKQYLESNYKENFCLSDINYFNKKKEIIEPKNLTNHTMRMFVFDVYENSRIASIDDIIKALGFLNYIIKRGGDKLKRLPLKVSKRYNDEIDIDIIRNSLKETLKEKIKEEIENDK